MTADDDAGTVPAMTTRTSAVGGWLASIFILALRKTDAVPTW